MVSLSARQIRACLGGLWLLDAALQAQPHLFSYDWWHNDLAESVMGQPAPVSRSILWATGHLAAHAAAVNAAAVTVQAALGLGLILGRYERAAITASIPWSLGVWWIGEGFGALPTGFAVLPGGAPGPVLLYPLIGLICWPGNSRPTRRHQSIRVGAARRAWTILWAGGAVAGLAWRFPAATMLQANIEQNNSDQPHWLVAVAATAYRTIGSHPLLVASLLFGAQLAVGAGVWPTRTRPYALAGGAVLALVFWATVQGLGGLASGSATDPGSAPLLLLLAVTVASAQERSSDQRASDRSTTRWDVQTAIGAEYGVWSST